MRDEDLLTILIVSGGGFQGQALIEGLRQSDCVRILLADSSPLSASQYLVDATFQVPAVRDAPAFIDSLRGLCAAEGVSILIPSTEIELPLLAEYRSSFEEDGVAVMVSDTAVLERVQSKRALTEFAAKAGVNTLPCLVPSDPDLPFPLLAKPIHGWGGRKQRVLANQQELRVFLETVDFADFILQEYWSEFAEYSVDFAIRDSLERTTCLVRVRSSTTGGFANVTDASSDSSVLVEGERFASYLATQGGRGIFNLQFLASGGVLVLTDVNPRIGTSAVYGLGLQINLPLFLCDRRVTHPQTKSPDATRMVRNLSQRWMGRSANLAVRAIVFDLDDTLLDHKKWIASKLIHVADLHVDSHADSIPDRQTFLRAAFRILEEETRSHLFDALARELRLSSATRADLIARYKSFVPNRAPLFPEVRATLAQLRKQGIGVGLLTDNPPKSQKEKLQVSGLESAFDAVVFSRDEGGEKPSSCGFLALAKKMQVAPKDMVMVGDSLHRDVIGALESGFGYAVLLCRGGVFHNPNLSLLDEVLPPEQRSCVRVIQGLRELHWHFSAQELCS